jgi:TM2 domain-containing membrane protein YozV
MNYDSNCEMEREYGVQRAPSPGIAAVLSVLVPGLGQVYAGRLVAGAIWFVVTCVAYSAVLLPGFLFHAVCVWSAYKSALYWTRYD